VSPGDWVERRESEFAVRIRVVTDLERKETDLVCVVACLWWYSIHDEFFVL
jgi:hypothetical protein